MFSFRKVRAGTRQKTSPWNTKQMKAAFSQARSLQMKQHSRTAPKQSGQRASPHKTDSKGAKDQTRVTLCLALQGGAVLRITDSRPSLPRVNVLSTNTARGKGRPAHPDRLVPWYTWHW